MLTRRAEDEGYSLIELLVAVFLVGVVGSVVTAGIITSMKTTRQDQARANSSAALRTAIDRVSRDLRASDPIRTATASTLTLDEDRGGNCVRTYYRLANGSLDWQRTTYGSMAQCKTNAGAAVPTTGWGTLVTSVDTSLSSFTYFNDNVSAAAFAPTALELSTLTRVGITIVATQKENRAAVTLSTIVNLRNAR